MVNAGEVLAERPVTTAASTQSSAIRSILFHVHEDDRLDSRLQSALSLARACSAHLQLLHVVPIEACTVVDTYGGTFASGQIIEALEEDAAKTRARLEAQLASEDISWTYDHVTSNALAQLVSHATLSDIVFAGREPLVWEFSRTGPDLLAELLYQTSTPICIPAAATEPFNPFGTAVVAWNGSFEAANAVRQSIGLIRMASSVRVARLTEEAERRFPDTRVLEYLSRHDIHAELDVRPITNDISHDLLEYAAVVGASYVVMGGYSHSRAGEFLFGGVTRELLRACPVSLVLGR